MCLHLAGKVFHLLIVFSRDIRCLLCGETVDSMTPPRRLFSLDDLEGSGSFFCVYRPMSPPSLSPGCFFSANKQELYAFFPRLVEEMFFLFLCGDGVSPINTLLSLLMTIDEDRNFPLQAMKRLFPEFIAPR